MVIRGMIRLETLIELKVINSSFSSFVSYRKSTNIFLYRAIRANGISVSGILPLLLGLDSLEVVQIRNLFNKKFSVNVPQGESLV